MEKDKRPRSFSSERRNDEDSRSRNAKSAKRDDADQIQRNSHESTSKSGHSTQEHDPFMDLFAKNAPPNRKELYQEKKMEQNKVNKIGASSRELNPYFRSGAAGLPEMEAKSKRGYAFGDAGSNWRMMKVKRVFETAKETGKSVLEVALERYASKELWDEAIAERDFLDGKKPTAGPKPAPFPQTSTSMSSSKSVKPAEAGKVVQPPLRAVGSIMRNSPSLPTIDRTLSPFPAVASASSEPVLNKDELNRLKSQALRAKLHKAPNAQELEKKFEFENARAERLLDEVVVLPTIDGSGRMVDLAGEKRAGLPAPLAGESRKKKRERVEKLEAAGEAVTLDDLVRQERIGAKWDMDDDVASRIAKDAGFQNDLEYMDDTAERIGKKVVKSDMQRKHAAIHDYKRTQEALQRCNFCYHDGQAPTATVLSLGNKTYLGLPLDIDMVPGHCVIVPIQHAITSLELDDDVWDEIRNFQKCLIQRFAREGKGVIFMETVPNLKWHRHTIIECIPVPTDIWEDAPAWFKDALQSSESDWSQHQKVIDTSKNGFRRSMVKNLPYFHVWFDPNRGYGHVIEGEGVQFPGWFGREVLAGAMDLGPELWRKPRRATADENAARKLAFKKAWEPFDWTKALDE